MKERIVRFTATARRHVQREHAWWAANRDDQQMFANELEAAIRLLAFLPGLGSAYQQTKVVGLRRLYLDKLTSHLYYAYTDDEVIVRALWGARRKRGPRLG